MRDFLSFKTLITKNRISALFFGVFFRFISMSLSPASFCVLYDYYYYFLLLLSNLVPKFLCEMSKIIKIQKQAPLNRRSARSIQTISTHTHTQFMLLQYRNSLFLSHTRKHHIKYAKTKLVIYLMAVIMLVEHSLSAWILLFGHRLVALARSFACSAFILWFKCLNYKQYNSHHIQLIYHSQVQNFYFISVSAKI